MNLSKDAVELYEDLSRGGYKVPDLAQILEGEISIFEKRHRFSIGYCGARPSGPALPNLKNDGSEDPRLKGGLSLTYFVPVTRQQINQFNIPVSLVYQGYVEQHWRAKFGAQPSDIGQGLPTLDLQYEVYPEHWVTGLGLYDHRAGRMKVNQLGMLRTHTMLCKLYPGWENLIAIGAVIIESCGPENTFIF